MMGKLKKAVKRIYRDYLMGSKLKIYKTHLKKILDAGYKIIPCKDLFNVSWSKCNRFILDKIRGRK